MHGNAKQFQEAPEIDARSLRVECPEHKGLLLPVTNVQHTYTNRGPTNHVIKFYLEALCPYCAKYHYARVKEGSIAGLPVLPWHE